MTIRYACATTGDNLKELRKQVAEFEAIHPNIRIKVEPIVDTYENKLLASYAANDAPDVANMNPNRFRMFAGRGALVPLSTFSDLNGPDVDLAGRYPNYIKAFTYENKLYAIPRDVACSAYIYYNKRLFREAKIPYPDGTWTWDTNTRPELREHDFVWVMSELTKRRPGEARPFQYGFAPSWPQLWMETLLLSSNVRMWDNDDHPTKLFLDRPMNVEVFQFAADCINHNHWIPSNNDVSMGAGSSMQDEFRKGKIAMIESGAWEIKDMREKMREDWDIAPFPRFARGTTASLPGEGNGLAIFSTCQHKSEAWEWIKFFCGPKSLAAMARAGESQPSLRKLSQTPGVWLPAPDATGAARLPEHLGITDEAVLRVRHVQTPDWFSGIANDLGGNYYSVLAGEHTAKEALTNLQRDEPGKLALALRRVDAPPYPFAPAVVVGVLLVLALVAWIYLPERRKKRTRSERAEGRSAYLFLIPWLVGLAFTIGPMIYSLLLSFADSDIIQTPRWRGIGNYADALNPAIDDTLYVSLKQTFIYAVLSMPLGVASAFLLALLLNQKVKGVPLFRALYYMPSLASAVAMSLIWMRLFDKDHGAINYLLYGADGKSGFLHLGPLISNFLGTPGDPINWIGSAKTVIPAFIIMGMWGAGGGTIMFLAGLQGIEPSYYEAATLDGASNWRRFRNVTVPMMTPYLFFSTITGVIGALQVFGQSFVMTGGGPDRATLFYVVWLYQKAFGELRMGYASALAWILFVIILLITVLQFGIARKWVYYEGDLK
ncbi:extracellular solute-binding protein [Fimbriimonas ginsengisoli]|uniref:N-Acetyl-D-glucosamine ABC transport system, permease protein 1 n=1 Tax=Fimbriimonas ginsengisoli Gsoil 348 TaxID=661478 RepID=A0A068NUQ6_FIMGI|nr:extracellular solute-binding protein [Fimbriimonas ginsengisoli]AIE87176.1 N-Acetyl-D-glucosamine ABC transport system, permease protein 1 [Fimbriimonas ginsengisoli Gsoil 348]